MKLVEKEHPKMSKLYIGNLPTDVKEASVRQLFADNNLSCGTILIKRGGYAFVDCVDQSTADKAIDKLNGKCCIFIDHNTCIVYVCTYYVLS